jgi:hypothetical protein
MFSLPIIHSRAEAVQPVRGISAMEVYQLLPIHPHVFNLPGNYAVNLQVTNNLGCQGTASLKTKTGVYRRKPRRNSKF